jgi:anti-sigma B factor antagonist
MSLKTTLQTNHGVLVVNCEGRIVFGDETVKLRDTVKPLLEKGMPVVLNLGAVSYVDSGGLGMLVGLYLSAQKAGTEVALAEYNKRIAEVLQITRLGQVFSTFDRVSDAIASLRQIRAASA